MKKTAFVYPGQGSQYAGMGKDLSDNFVTAKKMFEEADKTLGRGISSLCFNGPMEDLTRTINTQPAIYIVSMVINTILKEKGVQFQASAGHSLGEYAAAASSGIFDYATGLSLVDSRAKFMDECAVKTKGSMAAVLGMALAAVAEVCAAVTTDKSRVVPANINCPGQIVVSGDGDAVARFVEAAKTAGAKKVIPLPVSGAWHSYHMDGASAKMSALLDTVNFGAPEKSVYFNFHGKTEASPAAVKDLMKKQMLGAVLWEEIVGNMVKDGVEVFVEAGPGKVLTGLIKKINKDAIVFNVTTAAEIEAFLTAYAAL